MEMNTDTNAGDGLPPLPAPEPEARVTRAKLEAMSRADMMAALAELNGDLLTAQAILDAEDLTFAVVEVPEWGGRVVVRSGSGTERDAFESSLVRMQGKHRVMTTDNVRAKLCQKALVDPKDPQLRRPLFTDKQLAALGAKSSAALSRVYDAAAKLWGITDEDVEELAGNSAGAGSGDSVGT